MAGYKVWKKCGECFKLIKRFRRWQNDVLCWNCWRKHIEPIPFSKWYYPEEPKYTFDENDYFVQVADKRTQYKNPYKKGGSNRTHGKK